MADEKNEQRTKPVNGEPQRAIVIPGPCQLYTHESQTPEQVAASEADFNEACEEMDNMGHGEAIDYARFWMFSDKQLRRTIGWLRDRVLELESANAELRADNAMLKKELHKYRQKAVDYSREIFILWQCVQGLQAYRVPDVSNPISNAIRARDLPSLCRALGVDHE